jgi:DNA-directed RNA polymerase subunit RPC12/RpoP
MDLTIHQNCPSCGAGIVLSEADRLISCPYCDVKNFMVTRGPLRFVLPHKAPDHILPEDMFYAPYLRFKGNVYYCKGKFLKYKVVDTTQQGIFGSALPPSLGLRPQAMPVTLVTDEIRGHFLPQTIKAKKLLERAAQLTVIDSEKIRALFYHRAYIGETVSCIYLPLYIDKDTLYDAVTNKALGRGGVEETMRAGTFAYKSNWAPHFLATVCPHCGDLLSGKRDSLILSCYNCHSLWQEQKNGFQRIQWSAVATDFKGMYHLPFWRLTVRAAGVALETFADLLQATNQPLVIQPYHKERKLIFWIPAFKVRPSTFLRLGKNLTLSQEKIGEGIQEMPKHKHPVTLPRKEAVQALKSVLAETALNKQKLFPRLPHVHFQPLETELRYLPFFDRGHDFVQEQTGISIAQSVLNFGRKL